MEAGLVYKQDFKFDEFWTVEVLGRVDHGHGLEASNAVDASVVEDLKRLEYIKAFIDNNGPRPFNAKIDNSLLGATNISGLLEDHDTPAPLTRTGFWLRWPMLKRCLMRGATCIAGCLFGISTAAPCTPLWGPRKTA